MREQLEEEKSREIFLEKLPEPLTREEIFCLKGPLDIPKQCEAREDYYKRERDRQRRDRQADERERMLKEKEQQVEQNRQELLESQEKLEQIKQSLAEWEKKLREKGLDVM